MNYYTEDIEELNTPVIKFLKIYFQIKKLEKKLRLKRKKEVESYTSIESDSEFKRKNSFTFKELEDLENEFLVLFKKIIVECQ